MRSQKTSKARCQGRTAAGKPCGMKIKPGVLYCFNHDPSQAAQRAESRKRGGESRHTPHAGNLDQVSKAPRAMPELMTLLDYIMAELLAMDNGIPRARALIAISETFIKSFDMGDHEARITALEQQRKNDKP